MPSAVVQMTHDDFLSSLDGAASVKNAQAPMELVRLWDHMHSELSTWIRVKDERHDKRAHQVHLSHAFQAYEACHTRGLSAYDAVPVHRMMSQTEHEMMSIALEDEHNRCEKNLALMKAGSLPVMNAITYDTNGLGGSYGGMPRFGRSMLEGLLDFDSDVDTDLDVGSEATDLADSEPTATAFAGADMDVDDHHHATSAEIVAAA